MRKFILVFLILFVAAPSFAGGGATMMMVGGGPPAGGGTYPSFTYDLWLDFESNADCTAAEITKSDHTSSGSWTYTDTASKLTCNSTSGEYSYTNEIGATKGMAFATDNGAAAYIYYTFSAAKDNFSLGMWYKTYTPAAYDAGAEFLLLYNDAQGDEGKWFDQRDGGNNTRQIAMYFGAWTKITVANNTWYWITVKYVRNGTSSWAVYDTAGSQVGTTQTWSSQNYPITLVAIGSRVAITPAASQSTYFDDFAIDWTDSTFPLGP